MSERSHFWLRLAAAVLLAGVTLWPRPRTPETATARIETAHARTASVRSVHYPGRAKVVVATVDEVHPVD